MGRDPKDCVHAQFVSSTMFPKDGGLSQCC